MSTSAGADDSVPLAATERSADELFIRLPAQSIYVAVLRTAIAGLAARCDFTIEEIEDLRIAVDEASALLLARASPGSALDCRFAMEDGRLVAAVSAVVDDVRPPDTSSFGWLVLSALAGSVDARLDGDVMTIELSRRRRQ